MSSSATPDTAIEGGRVIDPETGLDAVRTVVIHEGTIVDLVEGHVGARRVVDASGLVVAPGFIDLHSHAQSVTGGRLQALDGVTTALDLESGRYPVRPFLDRAVAEGRPINYGVSVGWAHARTALVSGSAVGHDVVLPSAPGWDEAWDPIPAELLDMLSRELRDGAVGIGVLLGYAPKTTREEYLALGTLASEYGVGTFTHARNFSASEPDSSLESILETIAVAAATGAPMHVCHLNSTSSRQAMQIVRALDHAAQAGVAVSGEAYPYGVGATQLGAAFLSPEGLQRLGIDHRSLHLIAEGRTFGSVDEYLTRRAAEPQAEILVRYLDEDDAVDRALLFETLLHPSLCFASDGFTPFLGEEPVSPELWPLPEAAVTHPRSAGCFGKVFRWLVREQGLLSVAEAVRRCTLLPALILERSTPDARRKGRIQIGCDADIVVFDPAEFADRATFTRVVPSVGMRFVVVDGVAVVDRGELVLDALPGRPLRGAAASRTETAVA